MEKEKQISLSEVTVGELGDYFDKLNVDRAIFKYSFELISRHFLNFFLPINTLNASFKSLTESFLESVDLKKSETEVEDSEEHELVIKFKKERIQEIKKAVKKEEGFHRYICKSYLNLIKEPKEALLSSFIRAHQDVKAIDETLSDIQGKLEDITKNNLAQEIQEIKPILYYYQQHNLKAKDEILEFVKDDIYNYSLSNCYDDSLLSGLWNKVPYGYHWNPDSYKPRRPNDLENKFGELPYPNFVNLLDDYRNDKPKFDLYLQNFIKDEQIVFRVGDLTQYNHILDARKEVIQEALNIYEKGAKIMFANAIPTIIEGILHDLCMLIDVDENELLQKGFQYKLEKLEKVLGYELYYEYYSFRFRLFRNKVAHGRLTVADVNELSDMLLLDLFHVAKLASSTKLKLNQKRFVIDELNKNIAAPDYKMVIEYLLLDKIEVPSFYNIDQQALEVEKIIVSKEFWDFLEGEMDSGEVGKHGIYTVLKIISSRKPFDKRCTKLFKKAGLKNVDRGLSDGYIKYLTRGY